MTADDFKARWAGHEPGPQGLTGEYAVLVPLVERPEGLCLLYEVRASSMDRQPGEVCFPGGRMEPGESPEQCALRETEEELAIPRRQVELLGKPDFICNQAGFLMQPVLGLVSAAGFAAMTPSPAEVAETFTVPLAFFKSHRAEDFSYTLLPEVPADFPYAEVGIPADYRWAQGRVNVPIWHWQGHAIWGMTARITRDLADHLE